MGPNPEDLQNFFGALGGVESPIFKVTLSDTDKEDLNKTGIETIKQIESFIQSKLKVLENVEDMDLHSVTKA